MSKIKSYMEVIKFETNIENHSYQNHVLLLFSASGSRIQIELITLFRQSNDIEGNGIDVFNDDPQFFDVKITHHLNYDTARMATIHDVWLPPVLRKSGLGGYLINQLILWGQKHYKEVKIAPLTLSLEDARSDDEKNSRNTYYKNVGFNFDFVEGTDEKCGKTQTCTFAQLKTHKYPDERLTVIAPKDYLIAQKKKICELEKLNQSLAHANKSYLNEIERYQQIVAHHQQIKVKWILFSVLLASILLIVYSLFC